MQQHTTVLSFLTLVLASALVGIDALASCNEPHEFQCADGSACVPNYFVCDGKIQCGDGSDEPPLITECGKFAPNCTARQFTCDNKECVSLWRVCDGDKDCNDGSDEKYCELPDCGSHPGLFQCKEGGKCKDPSVVCDDNLHCKGGDMSDEIGCWNTTSCPQHTFSCKWDGEQRCVNNIYRCNGYAECVDGADELDCPPRPPICGNSFEVTRKPGKRLASSLRDWMKKEKFC